MDESDTFYVNTNKCNRIKPINPYINIYYTFNPDTNYIIQCDDQEIQTTGKELFKAIEKLLYS